LCHTGLVWKSTVAGRTLHFHLAGINTQNFIMRDEETGTWWQQVTGCGMRGPLAGRCLAAMDWDEVAFAIWRKEHPETEVLRAAQVDKADYATADWETEIAAYPTVTPVEAGDPLKPRDLVVGVVSGEAAMAYPFEAIAERGPIAGEVDGMPVLLLVHSDGRSLRCFDRRLDGEALDLFLEPGSDPPTLLDGRTGSVWDFSGRATEGPLAGRRLEHLPCLKDFWFDWKNYHPRTGVYAAAGSTDD
jgi:hypothetical protein